MGAEEFPPPPPGFGAGIPSQTPSPDTASQADVSPAATPASAAASSPSFETASAVNSSSAPGEQQAEHGFYSPLAAVKACLRRYAHFRGRASRSEFWWFALAVHLVVIIAIALDSVAGYDDSASWNTPVTVPQASPGPFVTVVVFAAMLPFMAVFARRMHDTGRTGWYSLWMLTGIGSLWIFFRLCQPGGINIDNGRGLRP